MGDLVASLVLLVLTESVIASMVALPVIAAVGTFTLISRWFGLSVMGVRQRVQHWFLQRCLKQLGSGYWNRSERIQSMSTTLTEADVEQAALDWLSALGWKVAHGPDIAPGTHNAERSDYGQVVLECRVRDSLAELNPSLLPSALDDAYRKLTRPEGATLETRNRAFHRMLVDGVTVEHRDSEGRIRGAQVQVIDFDNPANNDWLAVNQFTVTENRNTRRPDVVLFVNGLPLTVIELKNPADEDATIWTAWQQLQTYKSESANPVLHERGADGLRRNRGPCRHADLRSGVVQALAHRHWGDARPTRT